jgi:hypothetical protein
MQKQLNFADRHKQKMTWLIPFKPDKIYSRIPPLQQQTNNILQVQKGRENFFLLH